MRARHAARGAAAALAAGAALGGCGSGSDENAAREARELAPQSRAACPGTVMHTLVQIAKHVYGEGISSERTRVAYNVIARSRPLREAVERRDPRAAQAAVQALVAGGRMTNLTVFASGGEGRHVLADAGGGAVAPLRGTLAGAHGKAIASYLTSVWSDEGIMAETNGIAQSYTVLRAGGHEVAGSLPLPDGPLPAKGTLTRAGVRYAYTSFAAQRYPSGSVRVYLIRRLDDVLPLCGSTARDTLVNTLARVAQLIYAGEGGRRAFVQVRRVQQDTALVRAVAARDRSAAIHSIDALLTEHIVRLRVFAGGRLLADVGGPYVLAPVHGALREGGRRIGSFVLSIQDDEGYLRLARRLVGLNVLMYMGATLVKNSLGPQPGTVPPSGLYTYRGRKFRVITVHATAFPSGPLEIRALVPIPYS